MQVEGIICLGLGKGVKNMCSNINVFYIRIIIMRFNKKNQKHLKDRICFGFRKGIKMQVDISCLIKQKLILF